MAPPTASTPAHVSLFMRLPPELRFMIIDYVISPSPNFYWWLDEFKWKMLTHWEDRYGLLFTSRQLSAETQDRIANKITFMVDTHYPSLTDSLPDPVVEHIDRLMDPFHAVFAIPPIQGQGALSTTNGLIHLTDWPFTVDWCSETCRQTKSLIIDASDLPIPFPKHSDNQEPTLFNKYVAIITAIAEERATTRKLVVTGSSIAIQKPMLCTRCVRKITGQRMKVEQYEVLGILMADRSSCCRASLDEPIR